VNFVDDNRAINVNNI